MARSKNYAGSIFHLYFTVYWHNRDSGEPQVWKRHVKLRAVVKWCDERTDFDNQQDQNINEDVKYFSKIQHNLYLKDIFISILSKGIRLYLKLYLWQAATLFLSQSFYSITDVYVFHYHTRNIFLKVFLSLKGFFLIRVRSCNFLQD